MADRMHLGVLNKGAEEWNKWRRRDFRSPSVDLAGANLSSDKLKGYNLAGARLEKANLTDADLTGADLTGAILSEADLTGADLTHARLYGAICRKTKLTRSHFNNTFLRQIAAPEASFREAIIFYTGFTESILDGADFTDAQIYKSYFAGSTLSEAKFIDAGLVGVGFEAVDLRRADFTRARFNRMSFANDDLSGTVGLDTVSHFGPSTVGIDTIFMSRDVMTEKFLRGCGVPDDFITYMRSLTAKAIEFYSCFISYSSKDEEFAKRLYNDLQSEGVRCWFAPEDLKIGDRFRVRIDESIRLYDKLILILSENSVSSEWVGDEVEAALEKEEGHGGKVVLFPLRLDNAVMEIKAGWPAKVRRTRHIGDFSDWKSHDSYKKAFERLMRDLKAGG